MKAHQKKPYDRYRNEPITIGEMLDLYNDAKAYMIHTASEKYGKDVKLWPRDIQQEMTATFSAGDMFIDIMMALKFGESLKKEQTDEAE